MMSDAPAAPPASSLPPAAAAPIAPAVASPPQPPPPFNPLVGPLLTDLYQLTMCYAYWKAGRHALRASFDVFFRQNPFGGEYTLCGGLAEVLRFVDAWKLTAEDLAYLQMNLLPNAELAFFDYLAGLDCSEVTVRAVHEGSVVFPREPIISVEGPLGICQLLETTILNLTNFASLVCTNAARMRKAAGPDATLLEFGLRRAQGPDGGVTASRYSYMGGFDGTSNVLAGRLFGMPVKGTHAHAFVCSFSGLDDLSSTKIFAAPTTAAGTAGAAGSEPSESKARSKSAAAREHDIVREVQLLRRELGWMSTNAGELAAFIAYAQAFPSGFLALIDTYDTLQSGLRNFLLVARVLERLGYKPVGIRLDSGDLAWLSRECRAEFKRFAEAQGVPSFASLRIVASNDINEQILLSLADQGHEIDAFGIGTNLVTCQAQPALGMVYKLVSIDGRPRMKLSNDVSKITIPGRKDIYRLIGKSGVPLIDVIIRDDEAPPEPGRRMLCCHPFDEKVRVYVTPTAVLPMMFTWREGGGSGKSATQLPLPSLESLRSFTQDQLQMMRPDHLRALNATPYKVAVSSTLHSYIRELWARESPIPELE